MFTLSPYRESFPNNRSTLNRTGFVGEESKIFLESVRIVEILVKPYIVDPLSVSIPDEKLRLILDLT